MTASICISLKPAAPTIDELIAAIQRCLTHKMLKPCFREGNKTNPLFGHCYHSAEALYHLIRRLDLPSAYHAYKPCRGVDANGIAHWWLQNGLGDILDPTADQYSSKGVPPPYASGRIRPFLTKPPSRKAMELISTVAGAPEPSANFKTKPK
jgi:hypothetical protein